MKRLSSSLSVLQLFHKLSKSVDSLGLLLKQYTASAEPQQLSSFKSIHWCCWECPARSFPVNGNNIFIFRGSFLFCLELFKVKQKHPWGNQAFKHVFSVLKAHNLGLLDGCFKTSVSHKCRHYKPHSIKWKIPSHYSPVSIQQVKGTEVICKSRCNHSFHQL
jgi:hypothetical protein